MFQMSECPCGSGLAYADCCEPILSGAIAAPTAERLMRSRYTAYQKGAIGHLGDSLHPDHKSDWDEAATRRWADNAQWLGLQIVATQAGAEGDDEGTVEFIASYREGEATKRHHEISRFARQGGRWYYVEGRMPAPETVRHAAPKVGRNDPCPCGSGKKYKKCCGR
jgi:SEC-C motif-containing protein